VESNPKPRVEALAPGIGYVALQGLGMINPAETTRFASDLQQRIASIDSERSGTCGWVVDLRRNRGGNMWPMIAGLGPILGEGKVGAFVYPEGTEVPWTYKAGVASEGDLRRVSAIEAAYVLRRGDGAVAVLTGRATGSSGEAVVVAFRGRPHTRSFGGQTAGLSTSNSAFRLSDGAMLLLTTAWFADRLGTTYGGIIEPDAVLDSAGAEHSAGASEPPDTVIAAALSWLLDQKSCRDGR